MMMADAYPKSCFLGIDFHDGSIAAARKSFGSRDNSRALARKIFAMPASMS
jgi:hypothetical protein